MLLMRLNWWRVDQDVIHEHDYEPIKIWMKDTIHQVYKSCWRICKTKHYYKKFIMSIVWAKAVFANPLPWSATGYNLILSNFFRNSSNPSIGQTNHRFSEVNTYSLSSQDWVACNQYTFKVIHSSFLQTKLKLSTVTH